MTDINGQLNIEYVTNRYTVYDKSSLNVIIHVY